MTPYPPIDSSSLFLGAALLLTQASNPRTSNFINLKEDGLGKDTTYHILQNMLFRGVIATEQPVVGVFQQHMSFMFNNLRNPAPTDTPHIVWAANDKTKDGFCQQWGIKSIAVVYNPEEEISPLTITSRDYLREVKLVLNNKAEILFGTLPDDGHYVKTRQIKSVYYNTSIIS